MTHTSRSLAPSASEWVRSLPRGGRIDWDELESHVLRDHPAVLRLLGPAAAEVRTSTRGFRIALWAGIVTATLVAFPVVWAPVWGLATLSTSSVTFDEVDGRIAVPVAGASLVIAAIVQLVLLVSASLGRPDSAGIGGATALLAVLTGIAIALIGSRQDVPGWLAWCALAVVVVALGVANAIGARVVRPRPVRPSHGRPRPEPTPGERIDDERCLAEAIAAIPADEQARLLDDRRRAVERLRLQGTVSADEAARAVRAPLGRLGASV
ncbi:phosphatidylglycerophosphate synthase [Agromyces flavus]|uniref:Phosphatidylglycerophosphate synthase n=1 Tax=Agromyces flavus TaxID=589382 RepID=A0A1H1LK00_9MICO|nr:hypothetical protein [Agromyces flavus]MCP2368540.1 phosphatidylglycerophosphate synthase [Agromyces flavus]SDR74871.1 hypothetical protein SAMN04489721_0169 [Agromyces flavus]